jgi:hypothetical protein
MADILLVGDAVAVQQVRDVNITGYDAASTYKITINGKVVSQVGTGGTTTTTATALAAALAASTIPEFEEITWTSSTSHVIGTMTTAGKSFTCSSSVVGGTGTIASFTETASNDGPLAVTSSNFKNASTAARALPSNSDTLTIEALDTDVLYNLDALAAVTLTALYQEASMTGEVGLHPINEDGDTTYDEYRQSYLQVGATTSIIGGGDGDGSPFTMHDYGSVQTACTVRNTGSAAVDGLKAFIFKGTHASNTLKVESGSVDIAPFAGEVATLATLTATGDADVRTSLGTTLGTVNADGSATVDIESAAALADITAINVRDSATVTLRGDNPVTTVTIDGSGAKLDCRSSGTVTTGNLYPGATLDLASNPSGITFTALNIYGPCTINDPNGKLTVTNSITGAFQATWNVNPKRAFTLGSA